MVFTATHPADSEGDGGAGTDHQAGVPASPPALCSNYAFRAGDADRVDSKVSRPFQACDDEGLCRV
jgi:hypothetical protein